MSETLTLADDRTRLELAPLLGGGILSAEALVAGERIPILRPWQGVDAGPFGLGSNVLLPFSNRISGGGFSFHGTFHAIEPNLDGEPFPIHGDAFQKPWAVADATPQAATLILESGAIGPFRYAAVAKAELRDGAIEQKLTITNSSGRTLPFGGGFHPWFPRTPDTRLQFKASGIWLEDERHLPTAHVGIDERPDWDFADGAPLPPDWINNAFADWTGSATIVQPASRLAVTLGADTPLTTTIVYSPSSEADFFCFEPVSHPVDAHNLDGQPGLIQLADGETLTLSMRLDWRTL